MSKENLVPINQLCDHYKIEASFFSDLHELEIVETHIIQGSIYIHEDKVSTLEKVIRLREDLGVDLEAIDIILTLLQKIDILNIELEEVKSRLRLYED